MPRRCPIDPLLPAVLRGQDHVVARTQALRHGMTVSAIEHRLRTGAWQPLLPGIYLTHVGEPSRRQRLVAALLYAGPRSAIDAADACHFHGLVHVGRDDRVRVVVPGGSPVRSRRFVLIRRTSAPIRTVRTSLLRYVDPAVAVVAAARGMRDERAVVALMAEAVQRRITTYEALLRAHVTGPRTGARLAERALAELAAGVRSAPEADLRRLVQASAILPTPLFNCLLRLPGGTLVRPDALWPSAGLVHETNGRRAHGEEYPFEDMQARHDTMTAAGLTVLHNSPRQQHSEGRRIRRQLEQCWLRREGTGLPPGVELLQAGPSDDPTA